MSGDTNSSAPAASQEAVKEAQVKSGYRKDLGTWSVVFLALGAILGPAVAYAPVYTIAFAGPIGILSWFVAMIMLIPVGLVYSELGTTWPKAGGIAHYPSRSNGPLVGAINGWSSFVGYLLVSPVIVFAVVEYASFYVPSLYVNGLLTTAGIVVSEVVLLALFGINLLRIKHMGAINNWLTVVTVVLIGVIVIALTFFFHASSFTSSSYGGIAPYGAVGFFTAITFTIFGYGGFRQPIDYSEEVKHPGRSIPRAVVLSIVISGIIYGILAFVFVGAANFAKLGIANWGSLYGNGAPFASEAQSLALPAIVIVAIVVALIATFKDGIIYYGGAARVGQILGKEDRYFPRALGHVSNRGVPTYSVILVMIVSLVLVALGRSLATIIGLMVDAFLISYAPGAISLAVFRKTAPNVNRPYRLPVATVLAPIAFIVTNLMVYWSTFSEIELVIPLDLAGILLMVIYNRYTKVKGMGYLYGIYLPVFMVFTFVFSYFTRSAFTASTVTPILLDTAIFIVVTLVFYYFGVYSGIKGSKYFKGIEESNPQ
ncbi:MAG: APC family permease [Candidatus Thermoplasmatota archaeon]|nr:APC family permease [Candidatus Thermoplasmatota archaeon]MCL5790009.1 APC family permease [Candidatus Thermoplasmatota archaeon]